jgi:hypothetical protein
MSKLACQCGHVIVDRSTDLPYKGRVLADEDFGKWSAFTAKVAEFMAAVARGRRDAWVTAWYGREVPGITDASVVFDIHSAAISPLEQELFQCETCGRLLLQSRPGADNFLSFSPDGPWRDVLRRSEPPRAADLATPSVPIPRNAWWRFW